ncbi:amidohydrolase family protein [Actinomycetospora termitidis]|uniref:Amidohydrolase family protein n=1 Tax=Actinomycetospora termitidis TaxID=3053470 RepID=A0ABT7MFS2_9PSEU|nr:amidohydrolase family protein [Actinomycetospora sp. Odt1-22]MDL5159296.1 amidohydrolase family protein [Actinomycetospora sp. Odt1-22]
MRIDVHQHLIPTRYRAALDERGLTAGGWPTPDWDPDAALAMMDRRGIATGVLSISAPGVHFGDDAAARELARAVNEEHAELVARHPDRFGQFAVLTLPDVEGAVAEAEYALDVLGADGVVLLSNAGGAYLGDESVESLWEILDARDAVVFVHPTAPPGLPMLPGLPSPLLDFPFDTTRAALQMATRRVLARHPRLRVILSHAGGFVPFVASRLAGAARFTDGVSEDDVLDELRSFFVDTALSATPTALPSITAFFPPGHVLYGSDFPFAPESWGVTFDRVLDEAVAEGHPVLVGVDRRNAEALLPRLRTS